MKTFILTKKSGKTRLIYSPSAEKKKELRMLLWKHLSSPPSDWVHGFAFGRSIKTNALPHVGKRVSITFDLSNFFDNCTKEKGHMLPLEVQEKCFINGAARQGLPSSPAISNIIAAPIDKAIVKMLKVNDPSAVFTRYADDITISSNTQDYQLLRLIRQKVSQIVLRSKFQLNFNKTRIQNANGGRREICGLMVDNEGVRISRYHRRKLRGMKHKLQFVDDDKELSKLKEKISGLEEFIKLKDPSFDSYAKSEMRFKLNEATTIARAFKLRVPISVQKAIPEACIGPGIYITNDPAYFYGMSVFTSTWRNCMSIDKSGNKHKGVAFWQHLKGASLAVILSDKTSCIAGVTRQNMIVRCLVFQLKDGRKAIGSLKGHSMLFDMLRERLKAEGFESGLQGDVVGYVSPKIPKPHFDLGHSPLVKLKNGKCALKYVL